MTYAVCKHPFRWGPFRGGLAAIAVVLIVGLTLPGCSDDPVERPRFEVGDAPADVAEDTPAETNDLLTEEVTDAEPDRSPDGRDAATDAPEDLDEPETLVDVRDGGGDGTETNDTPDDGRDAVETNDLPDEGGEGPSLVFRPVGFGAVASASVSDSFVISGRVGSATSSSTSTSWVFSGGF